MVVVGTGSGGGEEVGGVVAEVDVDAVVVAGLEAEVEPVVVVVVWRVRRIDLLRGCSNQAGPP